MTVTLRANTDLVLVAWLKGVAGVDPTQVGTTLPRPDTDGTLTWSGLGFVQVAGVPGGGPSRDLPQLREPVVSLDCWAVKPSSSRPPWNKAHALAEAVLTACYDNQTIKRTLTLPGDYPTARVLDISVMGEPARRPSDISSYARVGFDVHCHWVQL